jgi:hypothetical protein
MTTDNATCKITFANDVPTTMAQRIEEIAEPDAVEVISVEEDENVLRIRVTGYSASISVFEEQVRERELEKYPSAVLEWEDIE